MPKTVFYVPLILALCVFTQGTHAQTPPIPPIKSISIDALNKELQSETSKKKELENNIRDLKGSLKQTKNNLVELGSSIQHNEKNLQDLENSIREKEAEKKQIQNNLEKDQQSISRLVLALQRIKRVPPEALIVKPGAPLQTAQSAMLMSDIIPALYKQAEKLKGNIQTLDDLTTSLKSEKEKVLEISASLKSEHEKLSRLIDQRQQLYKKTNKDLAKQQAEVERISKQAKSLNDLVQKLEEDKNRQNAIEQSRKAIMTAVRHVIPAFGSSQLPIPGILKLGYNELDNFGAPSKGIEIEGRGGALVVAPLNGQVRFAGPFKNYGNIVILEHADGYHSLIAGLEKIDTVVGHNVSAGEPLGILHYGQNGQNPVLYYELRLNGNPINPAKKLKGLG